MNRGVAPFIYSFLICLTIPIWTLAQFTIPDTPDAPCEETPSGAGPDTAFGFPDEEGFVSIFNGEDFSGWWQNCQTMHSSSNRSQGGIFRVAPDQKAIYSFTRGNAGGVLMTRKKFTHYEIKFDIWLGYGNDNGIFNRTDAQGNCYQTTLDYLNSGSVGGTWGEGDFGGRDLRPWAYNNRTSVNLNTGRGDSWTTITQAIDPTSYGCPDTGCGQSDYNRLWDADGWNEMRIQFYGGHVEGNTLKMKSWFRSEGADTWVPILQDTTWDHTPVEEGYIGIQQHAGGAWGNDATWFRNLKMRPLEADGTPIIRGCRDSSYVEYNPDATKDYRGACQNTMPIVVRNNLKHVEFGETLSVTIRKPGAYKLQLVNAKGKKLHEQKAFSDGNYQIDVPDLKQGVYFFQIAKGEESAVKKYTLR